MVPRDLSCGVLPPMSTNWLANIAIAGISPFFNRKYILKGSIFHCYVRFPECSCHGFVVFLCDGPMDGFLFTSSEISEISHVCRLWGHENHRIAQRSKRFHQ